jgi:hypothetical protein
VVDQGGVGRDDVARLDRVEQPLVLGDDLEKNLGRAAGADAGEPDELAKLP